MMYSVALALEDYVPVVLSGVGLTLIVRFLGQRRPAAARWAALGAALVVVGGLSRASWKLIVALDGPDVGPLYVTLFPFLAGGYLLLGTVTWSVLDSGSPGPRRPWMPALIGVSALSLLTAIVGETEGRFLPLAWLGVATLGSGVFNVGLFRLARSLGRHRLAILFLVSLAITIGLNGVARSAQASETIQWIQQGINTANQVLFLVAVSGLSAATRPGRRGSGPLPGQSH